MTKKETYDPMPTTRVEEARKCPMTTTTTTTDRSVEAVITRLKGYRYLNLATFRKTGVPVLTRAGSMRPPRRWSRAGHAA
jgi:hypothetical protein